MSTLVLVFSTLIIYILFVLFVFYIKFSLKNDKIPRLMFGVFFSGFLLGLMLLVYIL